MTDNRARARRRPFIPRAKILLVAFLAATWPFARGMADEPTKGRLLIIGGGLRPDNGPMFERLIKYAGGREKARFGIFPTASLAPADAIQMKLNLVRLGIPADRATVIDITVANAAKQAFNPEIAKQIRSCTGIYFEGGDQTRITRALTQGDGSETPALTAIYEVWNQGGVIAGSSAGAAVQSETMISVGGLPDKSLDEGLDPLDFGLTTSRFHRGLFVSRGLAFFRAGIIDQHFGQYRGRLGRLVRVTIEKNAGYGFGIDENTALDVEPDGKFEIVGTGAVTIVDAKDAKLEDGPLGCRMSGVRLSCLEDGDRFDPNTGQVTPRKGKKTIAAGKEESNGNFLIPDIAGRGAASDAIIAGLADNAARKQVAVTLKHNQHYAHGYRFTFRKSDETECFDGFIDGRFSYTVRAVRLDIEPIVGTLQSPAQRLPRDLPAPGVLRTKLEAIHYRGILLADEEGRFRPDDKITRAELAGAIAQTVRLEPPLGVPSVVTDVPEDAPFADEIGLVVEAKLMELDRKGRFHPAGTVSRHEGAVALVRLAEQYRHETLPTDPLDKRSLADAEEIATSNRSAAFAAVRLGLLKTEKGSFHPQRELIRAEIAEAIYKVVGFPW